MKLIGKHCSYTQVNKLGCSTLKHRMTQTSETEYAALLGATGSDIVANSAANFCRSSVITMDDTGVPKTFTLYFTNVPCSVSLIPQLRAVWPPNERRIASGRSFLITYDIYTCKQK